MKPSFAGEEKRRHPDQMFPRVLLWLSSNQVRELSLHVFLCDRMHSDNSFLSFLFFFVLDMRQDRGSVRNVMLLLELLTITGGWAAISGFFPNVFSYQYLFATCVANFVSYCVIVSAVCHVHKLSILWDFINYIFYTSGLFFNCFCWTVLTWFISCSGSTFPNWGEADVQQDSWARGGGPPLRYF